jgi:Zn-dependent protease
MNGSSWSVSLGCWSGVHVRLHITVPLLVLCAFLMSEISIYTRASFEIERVVLIVLLGLVAVATHAASHVMAAARQGIETRELVLAPWGEFHAIESPPTAEAALNTQLSGIMANALVCATSALILWLAGDRTISEMLVPLDSRVLLERNSHLLVVRWAFCLNYCLVVMNLIPASPFDGSRILKAALHLVFPRWNDDTIHNTVLITGRLVGLLLIGIAISLGTGDGRGLVPAWFPLILLGIVALFSFETPGIASPPLAKPVLVYRKSELEQPVPEHAELETAVDRSDYEPPFPEDLQDGPFAQWLQERRESERLRRQESEANDDRRADEILERLHTLGAESLSSEDRQVLERVSDRLRRRKENRS